jgi:ribose/xylose/arabinose/galactoside ABC-type transport system permease subunit
MPGLRGIGAIVSWEGKIHFALLLLILVGLVAVPPFRTMGNLLNILDQSAALSILALGQAFVIAGGLIDLSVGQLVGLVTVIACALMGTHPDWAWPIVLAVIAFAGLVGLVNGELINRLKISPLILTFGMLSVLQGAIFLITDRSIGQVVPSVAFIANGKVAGLPVSLLVVGLLAVAAYVLLQRSIFGWHLLSLGHNAEAARRAGIGIPRLVRLVYGLSGLSAGIAGIIVAGRLGTGYPNAGDGMELDAIVAVVLGGTPLKGGRANVLGILSAALLLGVVNNLLNLLLVPTFTQILIKGLIVIAAILADRPTRTARTA